MDLKIDSVFSLSIQDDSDILSSGPTEPLKKSCYPSLSKDCFVALERLDLEDKASVSFRRWMKYHKHCDSSCTKQRQILSDVGMENKYKEARGMTRKRCLNRQSNNLCSPGKKQKIGVRNESTLKEESQTPKKVTTRTDAETSGKHPSTNTKSSTLSVSELQNNSMENFQKAVDVPFLKRKPLTLNDGKLISNIKVEPIDDDFIDKSQSNIPLVVQSLEEEKDFAIFDEEEEGTFQGLLQKLALAPKDQRAAYWKKLNAIMKGSRDKQDASVETKKVVQEKQVHKALTASDIVLKRKQETLIANKDIKTQSCSKTSNTGETRTVLIAPKDTKELTSSSKTIASFRLVTAKNLLPSTVSSIESFPGLQSNDKTSIGNYQGNILKTCKQPTTSVVWHPISTQTVTVTSQLAGNMKMTSTFPTSQANVVPDKNYIMKSILQTNPIQSASSNMSSEKSVHQVNSGNKDVIITNVPGMNIINDIIGKTHKGTQPQESKNIFVQEFSTSNINPSNTTSTTSVSSSSSDNGDGTKIKPKVVAVPMVVNGLLQNVLFNVHENGNLSVATNSNPSESMEIPVVSKMEIPTSANTLQLNNNVQSVNAAKGVQPLISSPTFMGNSITGQSFPLQTSNANQNRIEMGNLLTNINNSSVRFPVFAVPTSNTSQVIQGNVQGTNLLSNLLTQTGQVASQCQPILLANAQQQSPLTNQILPNNIILRPATEGQQTKQSFVETVNPTSGHGGFSSVKTKPLGEVPSNVLIVQPNTVGGPTQQIASDLLLKIINGNQPPVQQNNGPVPSNQIFIPFQLNNGGKIQKIGSNLIGQTPTSALVTNNAITSGIPSTVYPMIIPPVTSSSPHVQPTLVKEIPLPGQTKIVPKSLPPPLSRSSHIVPTMTTSASKQPSVSLLSTVKNNMANFQHCSSPGYRPLSVWYSGAVNSKTDSEITTSKSPVTPMKYSPSKLMKTAVKSKAYEQQLNSERNLSGNRNVIIGNNPKEATNSVSLLMVNNQGILSPLSNTAVSPVVPMQIVVNSATEQVGNRIIRPDIPLVVPVENVMQVKNNTVTNTTDSVKTRERKLIPAQGYSRSPTTVKNQNMSTGNPSFVKSQDLPRSQVSSSQCLQKTVETFKKRSLDLPRSQMSSSQCLQKTVETFEKRNKRKPHVVVRVDPDMDDSCSDAEGSSTFPDKVPSINSSNLDLKNNDIEWCKVVTPVLQKKVTSTINEKPLAISSNLQPAKPGAGPVNKVNSSLVETGLRVPPHIAQQLQKQRLPDIQRKQAVVESAVQKLLQNKMSSN